MKPSTKHAKSHGSFQRMTFNARGETIWREVDVSSGVQSPRRCLILWTEFFEHDEYFALKAASCRRLPGPFLGVLENPETGTLQSCTIVTTEANELVEQYHPKKRMPVIYYGDNRARWLSPDIVERPLPRRVTARFFADGMRHWPAVGSQRRCLNAAWTTSLLAPAWELLRATPASICGRGA